MTEVLRNLPKHTKYKSFYKRGDFFWGLGVEHETYIQTSQEKVFTSFSNCMEPERYSVSYYNSYKKDTLSSVLQSVIDAAGGKLKVPVLMNGHSFTHADKYNSHLTTYEKDPKPNPKAEQKSLFAWASSYSKWFSRAYEHVFMWDGDTIEFMTQKFYKARVKDVLKELKDGHSHFIKELNALPKQGLLLAYSPFSLAFPTNHPFASYLTNSKHISMFNNGTIHINITLPTKLSYFKRQKPKYWDVFEENHRRLARLIQWMEPLWISVYGSPDPLAFVRSEFASPASQRVAVSRYIGLGTYDTETMPRGKILQIPKGNLPWYTNLHEKTQYVQLNEIGLDLNFYKHGAHGLELRFFDQMPYLSLEEILHQLVALADLVPNGPVEDPRNNKVWKKSAEQSLLEGPSWNLSQDQILTFCSAFQIKTTPPTSPLTPDILLHWIYSQLPKDGFCWKHML
jgi:hypothetical protein